MKIRHDNGIDIAIVDIDEALGTDCQGYADRADLVRIEQPPRATWEHLATAGFHAKPRTVTWRTATPDSEHGYLAGLGRKERASIRAAREAARRRRLVVRVRGIDPPFMDAFLRLYRRQMTRMERAYPVAVEQRDAVVGAADDYFAVCVYRDQELFGCCLTHTDHVADTARMRFSAVTSEARRRGAARLLYLETINESRRRGMAWVSLGNDPNLYGHIVRPGLFSFKRSLGFTPVPSHLADSAGVRHQADKVLRTTRLNDPALVLAYAPGSESDRLRPDVFSARQDVDLAPYHHLALAQPVLHHVCWTGQPE